MISAIVKGCYPYFSILAFCVIAWRIKTGLWNRRETIVLVCFAGHLLLEILQLIVGDGKWEISRCIGSPVFNAVGRPVAGIGITGLSSRLHEERLPELRKLVLACAEHISESIGYKEA